MTSRWKTISPSQFPWEQDALDFIQRALPNREPFRAYSNFEFVADVGSINEVDLLIILKTAVTRRPEPETRINEEDLEGREEPRAA